MRLSRTRIAQILLLGSAIYLLFADVTRAQEPVVAVAFESPSLRHSTQSGCFETSPGPSNAPLCFLILLLSFMKNFPPRIRSAGLPGSVAEQQLL